MLIADSVDHSSRTHPIFPTALASAGSHRRTPSTSDKPEDVVFLLSILLLLLQGFGKTRDRCR